MSKKNRFETTFGELMAQQGITKSTWGSTAKAPSQKRSPSAPTSPSSSHDRAAVDRLLETIHHLQQQRDMLRAELEKRDARIDALIADVAAAQHKLRDMEALRHTDMHALSKMRHALSEAQHRQRTLQKECDTLRRKQPHTPTQHPSPALKDAGQQAGRACHQLDIHRLAIAGAPPHAIQPLHTVLGPHVALRMLNAQTSDDLDPSWADMVVTVGVPPAALGNVDDVTAVLHISDGDALHILQSLIHQLT